MDRVKQYLACGTEKTVTGGMFGAEIETQFCLFQGLSSIGADVTRRVIEAEVGPPLLGKLTYDLGRQNIEARICPQPTIELLVEACEEAMNSLYQMMARHGAFPAFGPEPFIDYSGRLLWLDDPRDQVWLDIDGADALEHLARVSSFQLLIDVSPTDAIDVVNALWRGGVQDWDYALNDTAWQSYIETSQFPYRRDRYAGPEEFEDLDDYVAQLCENAVVMHAGEMCNRPIDQVEGMDVNLYLRSIWWHYRLRRFGESLVVEVRPIARRDDADNYATIRKIAQLLGE